MSVPPTAPPQRGMTLPATRPPLHDGGFRECVGLAALPTAVPLVRSFVRTRLTAWGLEGEHGWGCQQVLSELVTNAFDLTGEDTLPTDLAVANEADLAMILVQLRISSGHLVVEVRDSGDGCPRLTNADLNDEGGRGLQLATMLTNEWGWYPTTAPMTGKVVWASWDLGQKEAS
jgi:anti-sigma regulatory factor (Ser/Thr protein kinase)